MLYYKTPPPRPFTAKMSSVGLMRILSEHETALNQRGRCLGNAETSGMGMASPL